MSQSKSPAVAFDVQCKWQNPASGWLKCNIDAAVFNFDQCTGYGFIIRDENAFLVGAKNGMTQGLLDFLIAEAISFREALSWIKTLGLNRVVFESDALLLVQAFYGIAGISSYFLSNPGQGFY